MLTRVVNQLRDNGVNPRLHLLGILMTMFDSRTNLSHQVVGEVRQHFGEVVFETVVPRTTRLAEAPSYGLPGVVFDASAKGSQAYVEFARELVLRAPTL